MKLQTKSRARLLVLMPVVGLLLFVPFRAAGEEVAQALHGRVSHADGKGLVKGTQENEWSYATVNSLVLPGDTLWADEQGVMEVEFSGGTFLRMADGSKADVVSVSPDVLFRGWHGSFYVQRVSRSAGRVRFESPAGMIEVSPDTQARFDVLGGGSTTVTVRWGQVSVASETSSPTTVYQGYGVFLEPGYAPSTPKPFEREVEDEFDSWNRDRARLLALGTENVPIVRAENAQAPIGMADLNAYGDWVYVDDSYYWRPTLVAGYVPYRQGYWSYVYDQGYVWVGHHPFSYVTSHYGYWDYHDRHGWLWSYSPYYSPAYVASIRYGDLFVWAPRDRHGYPVYYGNDHFGAGGYEFGLGASSYVLAHDLFQGHAQVHGLDFHPAQVHADNIYVWNIGVNGDSAGDASHRGSSLRGRGFSPGRTMRGPERSGAGNVTARELAASLETAFGRARFAGEHSRASGRRHKLPSSRVVRPRPVRLELAARSNASVAVEHATRFSRSTRRLMARSGASRTFTNDHARASGRVAVSQRASSVRVSRAPSREAASVSRAPRAETTGRLGAPRRSSSVTRVSRSSNSRSAPSVDRGRLSGSTPPVRREAVEVRSNSSRRSRVTRVAPTRRPVPSRESVRSTSTPSRRSAVRSAPSRQPSNAASPSTRRISAPKPRAPVLRAPVGSNRSPAASRRSSAVQSSRGGTSRMPRVAPSNRLAARAAPKARPANRSSGGSRTSALQSRPSTPRRSIGTPSRGISGRGITSRSAPRGGMGRSSGRR